MAKVCPLSFVGPAGRRLRKEKNDLDIWKTRRVPELWKTNKHYGNE